jgi:hypothetical protein
MSADNGIVIVKIGKGYTVQEYNASTGTAFSTKKFKTEKEAIDHAKALMKDHIVEYGISFVY